jgi:hypothetical protein
MCVNLNWLSFFTAITVATAAFHSSGVYRITNTKGHTTFHSAINGLSCYVTNQTTAGYLLNRLVSGAISKQLPVVLIIIPDLYDSGW